MAVRMAGRFGLLLDREELEARGRSVPGYTGRYRKEAYGAGAIARDYRWKCWRGRFASIRVGLKRRFTGRRGMDRRLKADGAENAMVSGPTVPMVVSFQGRT